MRFACVQENLLINNTATSNLNKGIEESTISELEKLNHLIQFFGQASLITKAGDACSPSKNRVLTPEEQGEVRDDGANSEEITDPWTPPVSPLKMYVHYFKFAHSTFLG